MDTSEFCEIVDNYQVYIILSNTGRVAKRRNGTIDFAEESSKTYKGHEIFGIGITWGADSEYGDKRPGGDTIIMDRKDYPAFIETLKSGRSCEVMLIKYGPAVIRRGGSYFEADLEDEMDDEAYKNNGIDGSELDNLDLGL